MKKILALAFASMFAFTGLALAQGSVSGTVVDAEGFAVEDARVARQLDDVCAVFVYTDGGGQYLFEDVAEGVYTVKASKRRVGSGMVADVQVYNGELTIVEEIALASGGGGQGGGQGGGHKGQNQQGGQGGGR